MENQSAHTRLDIKALALSGQEITGRNLLSHFTRLVQDLRGQSPDVALAWTARGEMRLGASGQQEPWLHLSLQTALPLVCQRCMGPVDVPVSCAREFRFVASEDEALAQDEECEEDLLVISREFNLQELIEDELVMEVPLIPKHEECPVPVKLEAADAEFDAPAAAKPNPFAALSGLVTNKRDATKPKPAK
jgi:uncharacterized protein